MIGLPLAKLNSPSKVMIWRLLDKSCQIFALSGPDSPKFWVPVQQLLKIDFSLIHIAKKHILAQIKVGKKYTLGQTRSAKKFTLADRTSPYTVEVPLLTRSTIGPSNHCSKSSKTKHRYFCPKIGPKVGSCCTETQKHCKPTNLVWRKVLAKN